MIRVDNQTYQWLGSPSRSPAVVFTDHTKITPTQTVFAFSAGPARVVATFLSPIEVIALILSFYYKDVLTFKFRDLTLLNSPYPCLIWL